MRKKKWNQFSLSYAFSTSVVYNFEVSRQFITKRLDIIQKPLWVSCYFDTQRLDLAQNLFLLVFEAFCPKTYIGKYLKQFST